MNVLSSLISLIVGLVIPAVVSMITKENISQGLKVFVTACAAALTGGLSGAISSTPHGWVEWEAIAWPIALAWIGAAVTLLTGYAPVSIKWLSHKTAGFGIGSNVPPPHTPPQS
jgi:small basic protein